MKCSICGSQMEAVQTDLPFKLSDHAIVVIRELPVHQCPRCSEYLITDEVMSRVDDILGQVQQGAELLEIQYAA